MDKFEQWFINQDFYTNMRFIHGDALFIKDRDVYRVLPVQMTWVAWQSRQAEVDLLQQYNDDLAGGQCCLYRELKEKDKRIEEVLKMLEGDLKYVEQDRRENFEFLQMAMIRCFKEALKTLRGDNA